jgi:hypothetical protein
VSARAVVRLLGTSFPGLPGWLSDGSGFPGVKGSREIAMGLGMGVLLVTAVAPFGAGKARATQEAPAVQPPSHFAATRIF